MLAALLLAYLIGSIPFGLLLTRWAGLGDIRQSGSGNIGATNVLRAGGKTLGLLTLLLDISKGMAAVYVAFLLAEERFLIAHWAMLAAMLGHCFPLWLRFKGGKGVATALGVVLCYYHLLADMGWYLMLVPLAAVWLVAFIATRFVSLASILAAIAMPVVALAGASAPDVEIAMAVLMVIQHRDNIRRLLKGEEHRFRFSR